MSRDHWEHEASNWAAWARRPDFDAYWKYSTKFFELLPAPGRRTLEVGCGEGRVSRDLVKRGHRVTGVDMSQKLIRLANDADEQGFVVQAVREPSLNEAGDDTLWRRIPIFLMWRAVKS